MSPREFNEHERDYIRKMLIKKALEFMNTIGIKKTTVEDITRAVGISKGAFYKFYSTKEELFFEAFESIEEQVKANVMKYLININSFSKENLKKVVKQIVYHKDTLAMIEIMNNSDLYNMLQRIDTDSVSRHFTNDTAYVEELFSFLQTKGVKVNKPADEFSAYLRTIFGLILQKQIIGEQYLDKVVGSFVDVLIDETIEQAE